MESTLDAKIVGAPGIVAQGRTQVKSRSPAAPRRIARRQRRQQHGSAWHWKQTDCWYYTLPSTKRRVALFDEKGQRIRGGDNRKEAQLALARAKLGQGWTPDAPPPEEWIVAKVCSEYIQYCERTLARGNMSRGHRDMSVRLLNDLCTFCGALPVSELKKGHVRTWMDKHPGWKSQVTFRHTIAIVLAAFNYSQENHDVPNPLKGLKKPPSQPRLHSLSAEEEKALYGVCDPAFHDFLFAAVHTGLRPFCELARITADDVEELPRGMMWRVYSSKTMKTRKIPIRTEVANLVRKLIVTAPSGSGIPLFRSIRGRTWSKVNGVLRFLDAKRKLGWDKHDKRKHYSCYTCRHTFVHRMLSGYWNNHQGCSIETLAELIGDTPKVAYDHYGREWGQHYQEPLWAAIVGAPPAESTAASKHSQRARKPRSAGSRPAAKRPTSRRSPK
jgi:integrase